MLGPPKTAFASAVTPRNSNKTFDFPEPKARNIEDNPGEENGHTGRVESRKRLDKEDYGHASSRATDTRATNRNHKRGLTGEDDSWTESRARQDHSGYQGRASAINGETALDTSHAQDSRKEISRDAGNNSSLPKIPGRSTQQTSWQRNEDQQGGKPSRRDNIRTRDWNDGQKTSGRAPHRGMEGHQEQDPAWMNESADMQKHQIHTQEDFQRWKEKMKAGSKTTPERTASAQDKPDHERTASNISITAAKSKAETPLVLSNGFEDGFFSALGGVSKGDELERNVNLPNGPTIRTGKSKFSNFFAPKPETQMPKEQSQPIAAPISPMNAASKAVSEEDKEGFERILGLLGQSKHNTNQKGTQEDTNLPLNPAPTTRYQDQVPERVNPNLIQNARSDGLPPDKNSEFLLHLMQQPGQSRPQSNSNSSSQFSSIFSQATSTPQSSQTPSAPPGFPTPTSRPAAAEMDRRVREARQQAAGNSFFDTLPRHSIPEPQPSTSAPSMQRPPPGLDHFQSNFFPYSQPQPPQNLPSGHTQQLVIPPPGFPTSNQMLNHQIRPPPLPQQQQQHQQPQLQQAQYGMFPPGLIPSAIGPQPQHPQHPQHQQGRPPPPQGFMNGPPPGFGNVPNGRGSPPRGFYRDFFR